MTIKRQNFVFNLLLGLMVFFGGSIAFWIYDHRSQPVETGHCENYYGTEVPCPGSAQTGQ